MVKNEFIGLVERGRFRDPITSHIAGKEVELSALLALKHNWRSIPWHKVTLHAMDGEKTVSADLIFTTDLYAFCEYPLFPRTDEQVTAYGDFRADVLLLSKKLDRIVYVENKIERRMRSDLLPGILNWLLQREKAALVFLTRQKLFETEKYKSQLAHIVNESTKGARVVDTYMMYWEDVFNACADA